MPRRSHLVVRQFLVLYRIFLLRIVDLELLSADADPARLIGQFATIFAGISFFVSLPIVFMGNTRLPLPQAWTTEHFLIATTLTAVGLLTVLNWDAAFPDRRDILVLAPLPIRAGTLFLAKVAALFAAPALTALALNIFSGIAWPVFFRSGQGDIRGTLQVWPAWWITLAAVAIFTVCSVLAVQGIIANLLPRQLFLRFSAILQAAAFCLLISLYFMEPSLESPDALTAPANRHLLAWLPSYWFLGLFQQLNGSMHPALVPLARRAWIALAASVFGAGATLLLSYVRLLPRIVEQPDILPPSRGIRWSPRLRSSLGGAITLFTLRTLLRSRQHRMILSFYLGIGLAVVVGFASVPAGAPQSTRGAITIASLAASILCLVLVVFAIRVVASIPIALPANWIIRVTQVRPARAYRRALRLSWIMVSIAPLWLLIAALLFSTYSWRPVLAHVLALLCLGMLLVELCLLTFSKIPFTCSYLPGKANIHFVFWIGLLLFARLLVDAVWIESRILGHPGRSILMILILGAAAAAARRITEARSTPTDELVFAEELPAELISLNLH